MLKDEVIDVKLSSIRNFHYFYPYLDHLIIREKIVSEFKTICQDKNWKLRYEVLKESPHLLELNNEDLLEDFNYINEQLRDDHICCIRDRISQNLIDCYKQEHSSKINSLVINLVEYWSSCNNYIFRVSCL